MPIAADTGDRRTAGMTLGIVVLTTLVSLLLIAGAWDPSEATLRLLALERQHPTPTAFVGYALVHVGIWHLLGNMLVLYVLGSALEPRIGPWRFLGLYLGGAVCGGVAFLAGSQGQVIVGASGAVMAVAGAFLVFLPFQRVVLLFPLVLVVAAVLGFYMGLVGLMLTAPVYALLALYGAADAEEGVLLRILGFRSFGWPGFLLVGMWLALDLLAVLRRTSDGVGHATHLGGALLGVAVASGLLLSRKIAPIDRTLLHLVGWKEPLVARPRPAARPAASAWFARRTTRVVRRPEMSFSDFARRRAEGEAV